MGRARALACSSVGWLRDEGLAWYASPTSYIPYEAVHFLKVITVEGNC